MIHKKGQRLSLTDILIYCHCAENPKRILDYLHLLPTPIDHLSYDKRQKKIREAYALGVSGGLFSRHIEKGAKGYVFRITDDGQKYFDTHNVESPND